ncbi:hypothetical protein CYMTET_3110 [Cymbomonas tetramitiformis]|uniref:FAD dependent oxidoreductase domain-containing protein n=1 Tax=Cymbomonas tetramitiformis TaxID=36881 RepID=A0AAE0H423_9CHLO|nr:hypothetical protein CYMTET_3110 [Cymbomonas tetramitiformis]
MKSNARPTVTASSHPEEAKRYAIIGGGFAGVSTAWHILQECRRERRPVQVDLFDCAGIAGGASGAAAGLLHPYTTRGKFLWNGLAGFDATVELLKVAEEAANEMPEAMLQKSGEFYDPEGCIERDIFWQEGILRYATTSKQAKDYKKFASTVESAMPSCIVSASTAEALVPGFRAVVQDASGEDGSEGEASAAARRVGLPGGIPAPPCCAGMHIPRQDTSPALDRLYCAPLKDGPDQHLTAPA